MRLWSSLSWSTAIKSLSLTKNNVVLALKLHVLLPLVVHGKPLIAQDLLKLCDLSLLCQHLLLLSVSPLQSKPELFSLLLPFHSLLLKDV
jgi:hypothetical protein